MRTALALAVGLILGGLIVAYFTGHLGVFPGKSYHVELLSLFLGAATLAVAAVGVIVAIAAVVGYAALKEEVRRAAVAAAQPAAQEAAEKAIRETLDPAVRRVEDALSALTELRPNDRTEDIAAALAERDDDASPTSQK